MVDLSCDGGDRGHVLNVLWPELEYAGADQIGNMSGLAFEYDPGARFLFC